MHDEEEIKDEIEAEELEEELEQVIRGRKLGRKLRCTCDEDPDFCELHNEFA
jgi:hypothetical protein